MRIQYEYDGLGKLLKFSEGTLVEENVYDRYGNRAVYAAAGQSGPALAAKVSQKTIAAVEAVYPGNNRATGSTPDGAGNIMAIEGQTFEYDAENRMVKAKMSGTSGTVVQFGYDGDGRRVWKAICQTGATGCNAESAGAKVTVFAYDAGGALMAEYGEAPTSGTTAAGWKYLVSDHLGSTRMAFWDGAGAVERSDYKPFGEEIARGTAVAERVKFTGQQRDEEIKLDYFVARYMSPGMGRLMGVDPGNAAARVEDPQSWNGYSYVRNSPLGLVDPDGESWWNVGGEWRWRDGNQYYDLDSGGNRIYHDMGPGYERIMMVYTIGTGPTTGATLYRLMVWGDPSQKKPFFDGRAYSGGRWHDGAWHDPVKNGDYQILRKKDDIPKGPLGSDGNPEATWGIQDVPNVGLPGPRGIPPNNAYGIYGPWRARLNVDETRSNVTKGGYLHGDPGGILATFGCICNGSDPRVAQNLKAVLTDSRHRGAYLPVAVNQKFERR